VFRPQSGSNLFIVGQQDEAALGIMSMGLVSLAAQYVPAEAEGGAGARFYVLDGSPVDSPRIGFLPRVAETLPPPVQVVTPPTPPAAFAGLAEETGRRQAAESAEGSPIFVFIYDLPRFRDLRKEEEEFGFGKFGEEKKVSPAQHFATVLREGPPV